MKKPCRKLMPDHFLILVNNPKKPFHARNYFTNRMFWKRIIKKFLKSQLYFSFELHVISMSLVCTRISFVCHSYVLVCHPYVARMYLFIIRITRIPSLCHSYILVCHPYVTRIYSYMIRMLLVCGFTMNPSKSKCLHSNKYLISNYKSKDWITRKVLKESHIYWMQLHKR